jgi:hypothetical protein
MVGHDVPVVGEQSVAEGALSVLSDDFTNEKLPHFAIGAEFPVSSRMLRIFDATDAQLALPSFSGDCFPAATQKGTMNWA